MKTKRPIWSRLAYGLSAALIVATALVAAPSVAPSSEASSNYTSGYAFKDSVVTYGTARTIVANMPYAKYKHDYWNDTSQIWSFTLALVNAGGTRVGSASPAATPAKNATYRFHNPTGGTEWLPTGTFYMQSQFRLTQPYTGGGYRTFYGTIIWNEY